MALRIANITYFVYGNMCYVEPEGYGVCYSTTLEVDTERVVLDRKEDMYDDESLKLDGLPDLIVYRNQFECNKKNVLAMNKLNLYVLICYDTYAYEFVKSEHRIVISDISTYDYDAKLSDICYKYESYDDKLIIRKDKIFATINFDGEIINITGEELYNDSSNKEEWEEFVLEDLNLVRKNSDYIKKEKLTKSVIESSLNKILYGLIKDFIANNSISY